MLTIHRNNLFNYINLSQADSSGMLRFLTDELQDAEDQGDRGVSLATSWLTFTDPFHQFGFSVTSSAVGMERMG